MSTPIKNIALAKPAVHVKKLDDGVIILSSPQDLEPYVENQSTWIIDWARRTPDTVFLADRTGVDGAWRRITYKEFLTNILSVAQSLLDRGFSSDHTIAILSDNSIDNALLLFAAMHVGITVVPISPAYSLMSQDFGKLKHIIGLTKPSLIYVSDGLKFSKALKNNDFGNAEFIYSDNPLVGSNYSEFSELLGIVPTIAVEKAHKKVGPETVAKILFTSGSTGEPKGVINSQRMLCSNQQAISQVWTFLSQKPPITVDWLPWNHTFGGNHNLNMILRNGGTLYIDGGKPAPGIIEQTVANLKDISPTIYFNVPRGFDMLLPYLEKDVNLRQTFYKDLDVIFYAAAALTQSAWEKIETLSVQTIGKRVAMLSGWGATETAPDCTQVYWPISKAGVIGLPIPGTEIKLVPNEDKLEIRVRGPNVMPGYFKRADLTKEAFDEEGFYCIGDAARYENSLDPCEGIVFDGRVSENFKLSTGTWVSVGNLRTEVVAGVDNVIQDVVIAGHDLNEIGILIFPNIIGCRVLCPDLDIEVPVKILIEHENIRNAVLKGLRAHNLLNFGSSTIIKRALLMSEVPNIDANEITDKGYINQRAVLTRRANLVELLFSADNSVILIN